MTSLLTAKDWCYIRGITNSMFMPDVVTISNVDITFDADAVPTQVLTPVVTLNGQISNPTGNEQKLVTTLVQTGMLKSQAFTLTLPFGTAVDTEQIVTIGSTDYSVVHVNTPMSFTAATIAIITRRDVTQIEEPDL